MKLKKDETVCGLCREIVKTSETKEYIDSYTWGSFSGTENYERCCSKCAKTKLKKNGDVIGRVYA